MVDKLINIFFCFSSKIKNRAVLRSVVTVVLMSGF